MPRYLPALLLLLALPLSCASRAVPTEGPPPERAAGEISPRPAPPEPGAEDGSWSRVSAARDMAGSWEGSVDITIPQNREAFLPKSSIAITLSLEYGGGLRQIQGVMKVDMDRFLSDWADVEEIKNRGWTRDSIWALLTEQYFSRMDSLRIGDGYFLTLDISMRPETMLSPEADAALFLDPPRTRLRVVFDKVFSFNLGDRGFQEIILYRKAAGTVL